LPFFRSWTANQRSGHCSNAVNGVNGKTFPSIPFSRSTATVATERNYGNGTAERRNGNGKTATAARQRIERNGGNQACPGVYDLLTYRPVVGDCRMQETPARLLSSTVGLPRLLVPVSENSAGRDNVRSVNNIDDLLYSSATQDFVSLADWLPGWLHNEMSGCCCAMVENMAESTY